MRSKQELAALYEDHARTVWNICSAYLPSRADVEDAVQETFVRLAVSSKEFQNPVHAKGWLILTAKNICKDELRRARRRAQPLKTEPAVSMPEPDETLQAVRQLPEHYRDAIYLHYYEGYATAEIAALLRRRESTVRSDLRRGRAMLKNLLKEEYDNA